MKIKINKQQFFECLVAVLLVLNGQSMWSKLETVQGWFSWLILGMLWIAAIGILYCSNSGKVEKQTVFSIFLITVYLAVYICVRPVNFNGTLQLVLSVIAISMIVFETKDISGIYDGIILPSYEDMKEDKKKYAESFMVQYSNTDPFNGKALLEGYPGGQYVVQNPPSEPLSTEEMDAVYALPYMRSTDACYINKTYVEKLGYTLPETLTWDFIWEVSEAATKQNADGTFALNGQKVMIPFIDKSTDNMMIQMLKQKGAGYSTADGDIEIFNDTTTELLYTIASHAKTGAFSTFKISSYPANFLNAGQCVFAIDSTAGATWMGTHAPLSDISEDALIDFDTEVMMIPQFDPENPQMISQGPSVCVFNKKDSQEVLASWLFTQYLLTNDVQIAYSETEGYVPVTSKAQDSAEYQDYLSRAGEDNNVHYDVKIKASRLLLDNTDHTFVTPVFNGSASLRDAAGQMIEIVTKSTRRKQTVDDAFMQKMFEDVTSLYRLDQKNMSSAGKTDLGPLPQTAVLLLTALAVTWAGILLYVISEALKKRKNRQIHH